jgi:hypothetical protein
MSIATELTLTIHAWLNKPGVAASSGQGHHGPSVQRWGYNKQSMNHTTSSWANMVINFDLWVAHDYHD